MESEEDLRIFEFANDAESAWRILESPQPRFPASVLLAGADRAAGDTLTFVRGRISRAMVLRETGKPLRLEEVPLPIPGFGELRVRVEACAVCRTDLHVVDGELSCPTLR